MYLNKLKISKSHIKTSKKIPEINFNISYLAQHI